MLCVGQHLPNNSAEIIPLYEEKKNCVTVSLFKTKMSCLMYQSHSISLMDEF